MTVLQKLVDGITGDGVDSGLTSTEGTNEFLSYVISRFVIVLVTVMLVESLVVWIESELLLPALGAILRNSEDIAVAGTTSLLSLLRWMVLLLWSMVQANYVQMIGLARSSAAVVLVLVMLALLVVPVLVGALLFSRLVVSRVRSLQQQRERELALIDQQRSQFLVDIAHDLRSPLMAISGMAHAIADGMVHDDAMRDEYVQAICNKADKMGGLVSAVFEYTRLGSDAYELERTSVDLPQLLLQEAATAYTEIEEAGMRFSVVVPEERCMIDADPTQLARVVANLLVNAVRHNQAGVEIALLLVRRPGVAYVVVADTGEPIAGEPEDLFQPFSRGDMARSASGGSGLGLSICKRIADRHGYPFQLVQPYGRFAKAFVLTCDVVG